MLGRRASRNATAVLNDVILRGRVVRFPLIATEGFAYDGGVSERLLGSACVSGHVRKTRRNDRVVRVERRRRIGTAGRLKAARWESEDAETLHTSFVERLTLTIRGVVAQIKCEVERDPDETGGMKSRVHPKYKTKYRVRTWASYERALIGRGNITIWLSRAGIAAWKPEGTCTRGAPPTYSDLAIETALTLRLLFHLPLRQAEGFLTSRFHLMGLDLRSPDHTTLSRRGQHLNLTLRRVPRRAALHLVIDSTGLSMVGEGGRSFIWESTTRE